MPNWEDTARELHAATVPLLDETGRYFMETELAAGEWAQALTTGVEAALEAGAPLPAALVHDVRQLAASRRHEPDLLALSSRLTTAAA
jgi:hypothetical protein